MPRQDPKDPVLATNRKAFHDYTVLDRFEAGIQLVGTEVKSCRARAIQLQEGFVKIDRRRGAVIALDVDKMRAIEETQKDLQMVLDVFDERSIPSEIKAMAVKKER